MKKRKFLIIEVHHKTPSKMLVSEDELKRRLVLICKTVWDNAFSEKEPPLDFGDQLIGFLINGKEKWHERGNK